MASGGAEEDDGGASLDIDNVHMLLQGQSVQCRLRCWDTPGGGPCCGDVLMKEMIPFGMFLHNIQAVLGSMNGQDVKFLFLKFSQQCI